MVNSVRHSRRSPAGRPSRDAQFTAVLTSKSPAGWGCPAGLNGPNASQRVAVPLDYRGYFLRVNAVKVDV
jgi:hypothetical protein